MTDDTLDKAYQICLQMARQHYENFPTASLLLAKPHRRATAVIYAFARRADDIADEGNHSAAARHAQLDGFATQLTDIQRGVTPTEPLFMALADTIRRANLPLSPFEKLLKAFRTDIDTRRYASFSEVLTYCDHSANPVGELILRLHDCWNEVNGQYANHICTALQLINFIQDLDSDFHQRGRIYIPLDEMQDFGIDDAALVQHQQSDEMSRLIRFQLQRAQDLLLAGQPLLARCRGRLQLLLKLTLYSGLRMINKLQSRTDVFARPTLHAGDLTLITIRSLLFQQKKVAC